MSTKFPEIEKMRARAKAKVSEIRGKVQSRTGMLRGQTQRGLSPQMKVGGGQLINKARAKADQLMRKAKERRPGIISQVKEFKPGDRIRKALPTGGRMRGDLTSTPARTRSGKGISIADEPAKPYDGREIVIEA